MSTTRVASCFLFSGLPVGLSSKNKDDASGEKEDEDDASEDDGSEGGVFSATFVMLQDLPVSISWKG